MRAITDYLAGLGDEDQRMLRPYFDRARELAPDGEEGLSYAMPAWKVGGKAVVSLAATKAGYSVYPFSGSVLDVVFGEATAAHDGDGADSGESGAGIDLDFERTKGSLHFTAEHPLPLELFDRIVRARLAQLATARPRS